MCVQLNDEGASSQSASFIEGAAVRVSAKDLDLHMQIRITESVQQQSFAF
jgi:hypothetical protein